MGSQGAGDAPHAAGSDRPGPLGRLARLGVAVTADLALASIIDEGGVAGFRLCRLPGSSAADSKPLSAER